MFVSFLLPFVDRGSGPIHKWVMLAQMASWTPEQISFIGDERYFQEADIPFGESVEIAGIVFTVPDLDTFRKYRKHSLQMSDTSLSFSDFGAHSRNYASLLTKIDERLAQRLADILSNMDGELGIRALLSWCNCPSLSQAAQKTDIPVIHDEIGPLRSPLYVNTVYFDFKGVNGSTEPTQWRSIRHLEHALGDARLLEETELQQLILRAPSRTIPSPTYTLGIATQVEDDSNTLAYAQGWSTSSMILAAESEYPTSSILVRDHPLATFRYAGRRSVKDDSSDSLEFMLKCKSVLAINSSVLSECFLLGLPFRALGDAPIAPFGIGGDLQPKSDRERMIALNAYFLAYLVPASLLFDDEYYRWRLAETPSLASLHERHAAELRRREIGASVLGKRKLVAPDVESKKPREDNFLKNSTLTHKLQALSAEVSSLKAVEAELKSALEGRRQTAEWQANQAENYRLEFERVSSELDEFRASARETIAGKEWLESQLAGHTKEIEHLERTVYSLQQSLIQVNDGKEWLESQLAGHTKEIEHLERTVYSLQQSLIQVNDGKTWLEGQVESHAQALEHAQGALQKLELLSERIESEASEVLAGFKDIRSQVFAWQAQLTDGNVEIPVEWSALALQIVTPLQDDADFARGIGQVFRDFALEHDKLLHAYLDILKARNSLEVALHGLQRSLVGRVARRLGIPPFRQP